MYLFRNINNKGRNFVTIMIVIAVFALFLRLMVGRLIKGNIVQNDSSALATLKLISTALENYAKDNNGNYPADMPLLTRSRPAYLDEDYISKSPIKGYNYSCGRLEASGYSCSALPVKCKLTGMTNFSVTTGGVIVSEECAKKE